MASPSRGDFGEAYQAASSDPPAFGVVGDSDSDNEALGALAFAIKPTGKAAGAFTAAALAGMILGRLREDGWDVVRR